MDTDMKKRMVEDIKNRLAMCDNRFEFDNLNLEMIDDCKYKCLYAEVRDGKLYLGFHLTEMPEERIIDNVKYLNAVFNAIQPEPAWKDIECEIAIKLSCYDGVYNTIPEDEVFAKMEDGNYFQVYQIKMSGGRPVFTLMAYYIDEFDVTAEDIDIESLREICDAILPPRTLYVECKGTIIHEHNVGREFGDEDFEDYMNTNFPTFDWLWEGDAMWANDLKAYIHDDDE